MSSASDRRSALGGAPLQACVKKGVHEETGGSTGLQPGETDPLLRLGFSPGLPECKSQFALASFVSGDDFSRAGTTFLSHLPSGLQPARPYQAVN